MAQPEVVVTDIDVPLHDPVWSYRSGELIALTDGHRLAAVHHVDQPDAAGSRYSPLLPAGRNVQISRADNRHVFVPMPANDRVAVVDLTDMEPVDEFDAGPAPAYLSEDTGMRVLLTLSADGSTVTPVDEHGFRKLAGAGVSGGPRAVLDGSARGRVIEYHVYGPAGISYYKGHSSPPALRGARGGEIAVAAGDRTKTTRSYVADTGRTVLYAVDSRPGGDGLQEVGRAPVSSPIRWLGTDATRIYAATDDNLVVFQTASFGGYPDGVIPPLRVIDYRAGLPSGPARSAPLSGMAVGPDRVYLTLRGQPVVVGIAKPRL